MTDFLQSLIDQTVEEIQFGWREDGHNGKLPLQAERAARQVLGQCDLRSPVFIEQLFEEAIAFEIGHQVFGDWSKFVRTSLIDFIGEAAKQQMGSDYPRLLHERLEALAPTSAGD